MAVGEGGSWTACVIVTTDVEGVPETVYTAPGAVKTVVVKREAV